MNFAIFILMMMMWDFIFEVIYIFYFILFYICFLLQCGSMLHAQLEIWKAAVEESPRNTLAASWSPTNVVQPSGNGDASPSASMTSAGPASVTASSCNMDFSDGNLFNSFKDN